MKLNYKILWIDDNIEEFIDLGIKDELVAFIESREFIASVDCFEETQAAISKLQNEKYDLILSDYNIDEKEQKKENQGDYLITHIRNSEIFTEVLFYSAQSNFSDIAVRLYQDRVSFYSLIDDEAYKGFKSKTFKLIDLTVSKLQELNSIRGLVMSETSELDNTIEEILLSFLTNKSNQAEELKNYICEIVLDSAKANKAKAEKFCDQEIITIVKSRIFDADKKCRTINKLLELINNTDDQFLNFYSNYKTGVLDLRNDLAHAKSDMIDGIEYLIVTRKGEANPIKFNQEKCIELRRDLRKYSELLKAIREKIIE